ncbi:MAG: hypothetical protein JRH18_21005 [Deltaproteobacteria bacterium]|nr:hypothetical protein [Deltaproteobacteria bacterium]MBW1962467.1 hypothetical protein [Deltaproteobacteria bacterium]MBW1993231.1 hypothetical protein [Deltaproteobacteria bacterium]MBW2154131.1 hypothetical protein [Deltaproteobacteria bacterium]
MKILHILKSEPDETTNILIDSVSEGNEATIFRLYGSRVDYESLISLLFEHDMIISWW